MALPWIRLDANIATHDKILALLGERNGAKAFVLYVCALGYAGGHGTDGHIPVYALTVNHGTQKLAQMLIDHRLWAYNGEGDYVIKNWGERQQLTGTAEERSRLARRANCIRWHRPGCTCWKDSE